VALVAYGVLKGSSTLHERALESCRRLKDPRRRAKCRRHTVANAVGEVSLAQNEASPVANDAFSM